MNEDINQKASNSSLDEAMKAIDKASNKATMICFVVKFLIVVGVYALLRRFLEDAAAELWMTMSLAYALYSNECALSAFTKSKLMTDFLERNEENEKDTEKEQDIESSI